MCRNGSATPFPQRGTRLMACNLPCGRRRTLQNRLADSSHSTRSPCTRAGVIRRFRCTEQSLTLRRWFDACKRIPSDWQRWRKAMAGKVGKKKTMGRARGAAKKKIGARTGKASISRIAAKKSSRARTPARPAKTAKRASGTPMKSSPSKTTVKRSKPLAAHVASTPPRTTVAPTAARMMPTRPAAPQKATASPNQATPAPAKPLSHAARKKLAGEHLRALLEQKKRLATQTPAWQKIEHHDHEPREPDHQPHGGVAAGDGGDTAPDPDDRGES
jgi:hypothetical protein